MYKKLDGPAFERRIILVSIVILILVATGCGETPPVPSPTYWHEIDPVFRRIYEFIGGKKILGPPISVSFLEGQRTVQFTENAKLVFDPGTSDHNRFRLAPLGRTFGLIEPVVSEPTDPSARYVCGHVIAPEFVPRYEQLGEWVVGCPLTERRYNPDSNRYEQFFENLGFYRSTVTGEIGQLAYGKMACDELCREHLTNTAIDSSSMGLVEIRRKEHPVFQQMIEYLGTDFTGFALSEAYINSDGIFEQIFENVVLIAESLHDPQSVSLKPLLVYLHWPGESPRPPSGVPGFQFIGTELELGFDLPMEMWDYVNLHGGIIMTGLPISSLRRITASEFFQCFEKICLRYNHSFEELHRVRPEPLGFAYRKLYRPSSELETILAPSHEITMRAWERRPSVRSSEQQEVGVRLTENSVPLANNYPIIKVNLPGEVQRIFQFPPTNEDGITNFLLPQIIAPNGTLITYDICMSTVDGEIFCISDSFIIWDNP